jgi:hypothetical protein
MNAQRDPEGMSAPVSSSATSSDRIEALGATTLLARAAQPGEIA